MTVDQTKEHVLNLGLDVWAENPIPQIEIFKAPSMVTETCGFLT